MSDETAVNPPEQPEQLPDKLRVADVLGNLVELTKVSHSLALGLKAKIEVMSQHNAAFAIAVEGKEHVARLATNYQSAFDLMVAAMRLIAASDEMLATVPNLKIQKGFPSVNIGISDPTIAASQQQAPATNSNDKPGTGRRQLKLFEE